MNIGLQVRKLKRSGYDEDREEKEG